MEVLATYRERLLEVRREFSLTEDRVTVRAKWLFGGRFEHVVLLHGLREDVRHFAIRYRIYRRASWALAVGLLTFAALYYYYGGGSELGVLAYAALAVAISGGVVVLLGFPLRLLHFARFEPRQGRGGLDICSAGNDAATFEAFVKAVAHQISICAPSGSAKRATTRG